MDKFVKYLLCFFVGFLLARMIGDGFSVGGETGRRRRHIRGRGGRRYDEVNNLCPKGIIDPMVILKGDYAKPKVELTSGVCFDKTNTITGNNTRKKCPKEMRWCEFEKHQGWRLDNHYMNTRRMGATSVPYKDKNGDEKIYIMGGRSGYDNEFILNSVELFNGHGWYLTSSMKTKRQDATSVVFQNNIYVMGGSTTGQKGLIDFLKSVEVFDGNKWNLGSSMTIPRNNATSVVYKGMIYVMGGKSTKYNETDQTWGERVVNSVEVFNGTEWKSGPDMNTRRVGATSVVYKGMIYVMGGYVPPDASEGIYEGTTGHGTTLNSVEVFNGTEWKSGPDMNTRREGATSIVYTYTNGIEKIYVMGGEVGHGYLDSVEVFDGTSWELLNTSMRIPRTLATSVVYNDMIYVMGGQDNHRDSEDCGYLDSVETLLLE